MSEPSDLDLLYTDVEDDLRAVVRRLLAQRCDPHAVAALYDGDRSPVAPLWHGLATELGLAGLIVSEDRGGAGATAREAAVVLEELGRAVAPVPFLTSSVIAATTLLDTDSTLVRSLAAGETVVALTLPWSTAPFDDLPSIAVDRGLLTGTMTSVAGAVEADVLLVPVATDEGVALYAVSSEEVQVTPIVSLDMTRQLADVCFSGVAGELMLLDAETAVRRGLEAGCALLASEQLGIAQWCLEATVAYVKDRRQFGRAVGGFQALKHRLADVYTGVESAAAAARYAAASLAAKSDDLSVACGVAQSYCSDQAVAAAEEAVQLHGGIGMTWEHPAHLYLKRAKADQLALGGPGAHRRQLADLVGISAS
ncbi:acyl-CoA dehydrogenase family protein [Aeromicrobium endophyticum]|uniref:Acyl-CoA dehydrogenase n=1 Tax=Aeromicrobium endophyticum TaxID=2292704 RepID=A0A371PBI4_9ACTN|nr:acyl-CoA dehydrogenase family protein [Aeromicrobium endophyticum]REK72908.1 acyl-CoA dehydrogenase [Aeromicrobium endophyticum]